MNNMTPPTAVDQPSRRTLAVRGQLETAFGSSLGIWQNPGRAPGGWIWIETHRPGQQSFGQ
ncbi:MAG: hypothetical protein Q8M16_07570, partial [Pirellulaceae bacterium]|nr:hypothetical protein [Pirellulaceae bacterium]